MKRRFTITPLAIAVISACWLSSIFFVTIFVHQVLAREADSSGEYESLKTFTDVLALVKKNYVSEVEVDKLVKGAIRGMLGTLDPHSSYLVPETFKDLQVETKGQFGGLGIEISVKDGQLTVISPIEDSPAARAGILPGDQIIKIEDEFTKDLSLIDAVKKLRGPKGSKVTISVHRKEETSLIPITIIRDVIRVKSIRSRKLGDGYGYVRLSQFQEGSGRELLSAINKFSKDNEIQGLVLDLRNNPGGLLTQAIKVTDVFIKDGIIVYTNGRLEMQKQKYFAHDDQNEPTFPLVVLVNAGSASASEIVAGALQDHGRAIILGTQTFGKGSVQTVLPMEDGAALRLTTALYYTKSGRTIQKNGVVPDVIVEQAKRNPVSEKAEDKAKLEVKERNLRGAIEAPKDSLKDQSKEDRIIIGSREAMTADVKELLEVDLQLNEALKLLKTWKVFKSGKELGIPKIPVASESVN